MVSFKHECVVVRMGRKDWQKKTTEE
jgi:hypothetical protein